MQLDVRVAEPADESTPSAAVFMKSVSAGVERFEAEVDAAPFQSGQAMCRCRAAKSSPRPASAPAGMLPLERRAEHEESPPKSAAARASSARYVAGPLANRRRRAR